MAGTDERASLSEAGAERGWNRREHGRVDVFLRDRYRVRVIWQGTDVISGASFFDDEMYEGYTRDLAKVRTWLKK
ncbi:hypothetical protein ORI20_02575 [Mycobacterium sp. CVI_P3]|uniref:Uncharacterized protein n=1 Tax=Mycobacterium pinniadriaticum TaxID=2994102 RepID=A0ABT3S7V8_9MYCO|nr:hypothetical protein [Mycobacterium pinniadriaticum]MCX2929144.1 hypothetical protein [Mycobacterium pinniadriaticum]MCX2935569.1 hypothetical protein [Mycobacterium pinniadriaticum]